MEEKPTFQHPQSQSMQPVLSGSTPDINTVSQAISEVQNQMTSFQNRRINLNTDIIGLFETVFVAPTLIPNGPYGQLKIALISGTYYFYAYTGVSGGWKRTTLS